MISQIILNILITTSIYVAIAKAFSYFYYSVKFIDFSYAIIFTLTPYSFYYFHFSNNLNFVLSILLSLLFSILFMVLIYKFIYNFFQNIIVSSKQMILVSLGLYIVFENLISIIFGDDFKNIRTWKISEGYHFMDIYITPIQITTLILSSFLLFLSWYISDNTNIGKKIKAQFTNPSLVSIIGLSKEKIVISSYVFGTIISSIIGLLISFDTNLAPTMGFKWLLLAIVVMIISGFGKNKFFYASAILLSSAQHLSAYYLDTKWMNATAFIILIIFIYFKPYGFSGQKLKKAEI